MAITLPPETKETLPEIKKVPSKLILNIGKTLGLFLFCLAIGLIYTFWDKLPKPDRIATTTSQGTGDIYLNQPPASRFGYINVKPGDKISLKIKSPIADPQQFIFNDFFQVVSILGNPKDPLKKLTDFEAGDIWVLVKSCDQKPLPSYFILRALIKPGEIDNRLLELRANFENGEFLDQDKAKISNPGLFIFLSIVYTAEDDKATINVIDPLNSERDLATFSVGKNFGQGIRAGVFASKEAGELVVIVDEKLKFCYHCDEGFFSSRSYFYGFNLCFLKETEIKCRPEMASILPNAMEATLNQLKIEWEKVGLPPLEETIKAETVKASSPPQTTSSAPINPAKKKRKKS